MVVLAGGIYLAAYLIRSLSHEEVEDAYVAGTIVPIASEVKGRVVKINFKDNQSVDAGKPLLEIAPDDFSSVFQERKETISRLTAEEREIQAAVEEKKQSPAAGPGKFECRSGRGKSGRQRIGTE